MARHDSQCVKGEFAGLAAHIQQYRSVVFVEVIPRVIFQSPGIGWDGRWSHSRQLRVLHLKSAASPMHCHSFKRTMSVIAYCRF